MHLQSEDVPTMFPGNSKQDGRGPDVVDIRADKQDSSLLKSLRVSLSGGASGDEPPTFPSLLLWNERGLKIFEAITYSKEYYLTRSEIDVLERYSVEIAGKMKPGTMLVELGSGNLRKIKILLQAIDNLGTPVDYYALDLSHSELKRSLKQIPPGTFKHVRCHGLLGTYDDGRKWLQRPENVRRPKCILSLGSTIGSFSRPEAAEFLSGFAQSWDCRASSTDPQHVVQCSMLVGVDASMLPEKVLLAYNDPAGLNANFILNVLEHANTMLGYEAFSPADWTVKGDWDTTSGAHYQYLVPLRDIEFESKLFKAGQKIFVVQSLKYDAKQKAQLWQNAGLGEAEHWLNTDGSYGLHLLDISSSLPN